MSSPVFEDPQALKSIRRLPLPLVALREQSPTYFQWLKMSCFFSKVSKNKCLSNLSNISTKSVSYHIKSKHFQKFVFMFNMHTLYNVCGISLLIF